MDTARELPGGCCNPVEEQRARWERKRCRTAKELVATEQEYVEQLELMTTYFVAVLKAQRTLKPAVQEAIFGPLEPLCAASRVLLFHLERGRFQTGLEGFSGQLGLYVHYAENLARAKKALQEQVRKNKPFSRFKKLQERRPEFKGCHLEDLLPLPLQRLHQRVSLAGGSAAIVPLSEMEFCFSLNRGMCPLTFVCNLSRRPAEPPTWTFLHKGGKPPGEGHWPLSSPFWEREQKESWYRCSLQVLVENTSLDRSDSVWLTGTLRSVSEAFHQVQEISRFQENSDRLCWVQKRLQGQKTQVLAPGRWYLQEGWLMVVPPKGEQLQHRMFFLFSDILLMTRPCHPLHPWSAHKLACQAVFPLSQCTVGKVFGHTRSQGGLLSLSFPHEKLLLLSCDEEALDKWHRNLLAAVRQLQVNPTEGCLGRSPPRKP